MVGAARLLADDATGIAERRGEGRAEHFIGHLAAPGLEQRQLRGIGQAACGQFGVLEVALVTLVGAEEQLLVGPLEIEQQGNRLAHPAVLEDRAAQVEGKTLHAHRVAVRQRFLDEAPVT